MSEIIVNSRTNLSREESDESFSITLRWQDIFHEWNFSKWDLLLKMDRRVILSAFWEEVQDWLLEHVPVEVIAREEDKLPQRVSQLIMRHLT